MDSEEYLDGEGNPIQQGWYLGLFQGSSNSTASQAVRSIAFVIRQEGELFAHSDKVPVRITQEYARCLYALDLRIYLLNIKSHQDRALGILEKMVAQGVIPFDVMAGIRTTLNSSEFTEGRGSFSRNKDYKPVTPGVPSRAGAMDDETGSLLL
jgi:hypothetical protein